MNRDFEILFNQIQRLIERNEKRLEFIDREDNILRFKINKNQNLISIIIDDYDFIIDEFNFEDDSINIMRINHYQFEYDLDYIYKLFENFIIYKLIYLDDNIDYSKS